MSKNKKEKDLLKIDEKAAHTEAYHCIMATGNAFSLLCPNIPKTLMKVSQEIHYSIYKSAKYCFHAANSYDMHEKFNYLDKAKQELFFLYAGIEYLVKARALTIGAANTIISPLKESYDQVSKWFKATQTELNREADNLPVK